MTQPRHRLDIALPALVAALWCVSFGASASNQNLQADRLQNARVALGGVERLATIKTARFIGERQTRNEWYRPGSPAREFSTAPLELLALMPDHYLWATTRPSPTKPNETVGFRGQTFIPVADKALWASDPSWLFDDFARLMLAVFLRTDTLVPLKLEGLKSDRLRFSNRGKAFAEIELDGSSLPMSLNYEEKTSDGKKTESARWVLEERRVIGGVSVPTRIVMFQAGTHRWTYRFSDIQINPKITSADFKDR